MISQLAQKMRREEVSRKGEVGAYDFAYRHAHALAPLRHPAAAALRHGLRPRDRRRAAPALPAGSRGAASERDRDPRDRSRGAGAARPLRPAHRLCGARARCAEPGAFRHLWFRRDHIRAHRLDLVAVETSEGLAGEARLLYLYKRFLSEAEREGRRGDVRARGSAATSRGCWSTRCNSSSTRSRSLPSMRCWGLPTRSSTGWSGGSTWRSGNWRRRAAMPPISVWRSRARPPASLRSCSRRWPWP